MTALTFALLAALGLAFALSMRASRQRRGLEAGRRELEARVTAQAADLEKRTQALLEANAARSRFFARVSHEIRTPLSGLLGINRMLLQTGLDARQRELADIVQAQGAALLAIINDILDYSKMEAGRFGLAPADFSLRDTIHEVARVHEEQAQAKSLGFAIDIDPALHDAVHGDALRLRQVLDNLLLNAVKFTDSGAITLRVTQVASDPGDVVARFEVADTGIGVGPAAARVLFQPFTQEEGGARRPGGTGLGLAIAKSLVGLMGGEIGCLGAPGRGSTFWFTIRVRTAAAAGAAREASPAEAPVPAPMQSPRRGRVLIAEDNEVNRMVSVALLEDAGFTVETVATGIDAVAACSRQRYDLVLMDCRMPGMDGYEAAQAIRRAESRGDRTPIVALTAHAVADERERCLAAGMDDFITKPATPEVIAQVASRWIPAEPASGPLSAATLDDLERRSPAVLRTVIQHYVSGIPLDMVRLHAAARAGDRGQLQTLAHDLKGSALVVGARDLADILRQAEAADETLALEPWIAQVHDEHVRVLEALRDRLGTTM